MVAAEIRLSAKMYSMDVIANKNPATMAFHVVAPKSTGRDRCRSATSANIARAVEPPR